MKFLELKNNIDDHDFLFKKIAVKDLYYTKNEYLSFSDDLLFLFEDIGNYPKEKFIQIVKQSIPEKNPIVYNETTLKIFQ